MLGTLVPEAAIDEDCDSPSSKHDVRSDSNFACSHRKVLAETEAGAVES
jgi:hypothetical protein